MVPGADSLLDDLKDSFPEAAEGGLGPKILNYIKGTMRQSISKDIDNDLVKSGSLDKSAKKILSVICETINTAKKQRITKDLVEKAYYFLNNDAIVDKKEAIDGFIYGKPIKGDTIEFSHMDEAESIDNNKSSDMPQEEGEQPNETNELSVEKFEIQENPSVEKFEIQENPSVEKFEIQENPSVTEFEIKENPSVTEFEIKEKSSGTQVGGAGMVEKLAASSLLDKILEKITYRICERILQKPGLVDDIISTSINTFDKYMKSEIDGKTETKIQLILQPLAEVGFHKVNEIRMKKEEIKKNMASQNDEHLKYMISGVLQQILDKNDNELTSISQNILTNGKDLLISSLKMAYTKEETESKYNLFIEQLDVIKEKYYSSNADFSKFVDEMKENLSKEKDFILNEQPWKEQQQQEKEVSVKSSGGTIKNKSMRKYKEYKSRTIKNLNKTHRRAKHFKYNKSVKTKK